MNASISQAEVLSSQKETKAPARQKPMPFINHLPKYIAYSMGAFAILFALISFITQMNLSDILEWIAKYFGASFTFFYCFLVCVAAYSLFRLHTYKEQKVNMELIAGQALTQFWHQVGMQAANGVSTLALTYTLLGISLGIGSLAEQSLTPENVNNVISILTTQFSMAFMTTVIGLPTATAIRAWLSIIYVKHQNTPQHCQRNLPEHEELS